MILFGTEGSSILRLVVKSKNEIFKAAIQCPEVGKKKEKSKTFEINVPLGWKLGNFWL